MANFFSQRMKHWNADNDIYGLWNHSSLRKKKGCHLATISTNNSSSKDDSFATSNVVHALHWNCEGHYDTLQYNYK